MQITVRDLSYTYPGQPPLHTLDHMNFTVIAGQFVALIGPSGCGKSTLLRLAANLLLAPPGSLLLDGRPPVDSIRQQRVAWMAQSPALLPWLTAGANIAIAEKIHNQGIHLRMTPEEALGLVGLSDCGNKYPAQLSGGMQQRLALARTLCLPASLWLMDEPFASLDELTRERLASELIELWQQMHPTVLWVTHNIYEAVRLADRALVFSSRPASIRADLAIPLERPRREDAPDFLDLVFRLRQALGVSEGRGQP